MAFAEDFAPAVVRPHLPDTTRGWLAEHDAGVRLEYFACDWSLNALGAAR